MMRFTISIIVCCVAIAAADVPGERGEHVACRRRSAV